MTPQPTRVRINSRDAVRAGDLAACRGDTDVVATGSATVKIGSMPAARQDDTTAHGGKIVRGAKNVRIGGPSISPPGLDVMVENSKEIGALMWRISVRKKKLAELHYKLNPREKSPAENMFEKGFKLRDPQGAPRDYETEARVLEECRQRWRNEVHDHQQRLSREEARLRDLETENEARRRGQRPPPPPRDPLLDKPKTD